MAEAPRGRPLPVDPRSFPDVTAIPVTPRRDRAAPTAGRQAGGAALILTNDERMREAMRGWVKDIGSHATTMSAAELPEGWVAHHAEGFDFCVIDSDFMGDEALTLDLCLRLKHAARNLPIVFLDTALGATDSTAEAMNLCDRRLPADVTAAGFVEGVQSAMIRVAVRQTRPDAPSGYRLDLNSAMAEAGFGSNLAAATELRGGMEEASGTSPGWWILPAAALGTLGWAGIIALVVAAF